MIIAQNDDLPAPYRTVALLPDSIDPGLEHMEHRWRVEIAHNSTWDVEGYLLEMNNRLTRAGIDPALGEFEIVCRLV